jgi:FAD synthase
VSGRDRSIDGADPVDREPTFATVAPVADDVGMTQPAPLRAPLECPSLRSVLVAHHRACVATIGTFDGVHPGHRALVAHAHRLARARGLNLTAVTFSPRPDQVLRPQRALPDLCSLPERLLRLRLAGADDVVVVPFSHAIAEMSAETFVTHLRRDLGAQALCVGEDFTLGRHRRGDVNALCTMGIEVDTFPLQDGVDGRKISSSAMRAAIELARAPRSV